MRIGIDFDRVLFDTDAFNEYIKNETRLHHVDAEVYDSQGNYDPERHAKACGIPVKEIYDAMENLERFLFDDVELLEKLDDVVIVTRGEEEFQVRKLEGSGILEFVDDYIVVENGSKDVDGIDFLVDDWEKELDDAGVPGMVFDRERHGLKDVLEKVTAIET